MSMKYTLDQTPVLAEVMDSGDSVTVEIYNKSTGAAVGLDSSTATEIGSTGIYRYTVDFTSPPGSGENSYIYVFTGTLQKRYGEFDWDDCAACFNGKICIDTAAGTSGTDYPRGTESDPVDNVTDARTIANRYNLKAYQIRGSITLDQDHLNWTFQGAGSASVAAVAIAGYDVTGSSFDAVTISGAIGGSIPKLIIATDCILDTITGWDGIATNGGIEVGVTLEAGPGAFCRFDNMAALTFGGVTLNANGLNNVQWGGATGVIIIAGFTGGGLLQFAAEAAILTLDATCVGGVAILAGFTTLSNLSAMTIFLDETLNRQALRNVMKLAPSGGAPAAGSVDQHLDDVQTATDQLAFTAGDVHATLDGELVDLADDAITAAKFDETTAFPLKSADAGATEVARTGADGDTLETLSDQLDSIVGSIATNATTLELLKQYLGGKWVISSDNGGTMRFYEDDNTTLIAEFALFETEAGATRTTEQPQMRERL